jgi:hypothetical protein
MAGYSGTPLARKLGIKDGHRIAFLEMPDTLLIDGLPSEVTLSRSAGRQVYDVIVLFVRSLKPLQRQFNRLVRRLNPTGGLWVAWPKKSSGETTDLSENVVRSVGLAAGLVDNKVCAIDETWSGLRFVFRIRDRPKE